MKLSVFLSDADIRSGTAAALVKVVDGLIEQREASAVGLLGTKLAKVISDYRKNMRGTQARAVTASMLNEILSSLGDLVATNDREIIALAFQSERDAGPGHKRRVARGKLLFGLKPSEALTAIGKSFRDRSGRPAVAPDDVRRVMQNVALRDFRRSALEAPSVGNRRRWMAGEPLAKATLALASAELAPFSDLPALDLGEIVSEAALVVGWIAFQAEDVIDLEVALEQAGRAANETRRASPILNRHQLEFLRGELKGHAVDAKKAFGAIGKARTGPLEPLPNVLRAIEARYAKSLMTTVGNPYGEHLHGQMSLIEWLTQLRDRAVAIKAYESVVVGDVALVEVCAHHFGRGEKIGNTELMQRCKQTALAAFGDLCFRMEADSKYCTPVTKKHKIDALEIIKTLGNVTY